MLSEGCSSLYIPKQSQKAVGGRQRMLLQTPGKMHHHSYFLECLPRTLSFPLLLHVILEVLWLCACMWGLQMGNTAMYFLEYRCIPYIIALIIL